MPMIPCGCSPRRDSRSWEDHAGPGDRGPCGQPTLRQVVCRDSRTDPCACFGGGHQPGFFVQASRGSARPADHGPPSVAQRRRSVSLQMVLGRLDRGDRGLVAARRRALARAAVDRAGGAVRRARLSRRVRRAILWLSPRTTTVGVTITAAGLGGGENDPERASLEGLILGAAAGALFGVSAVAIKYITQASPGPLLGLVSPWTLTAMIAGVIAFYASARSLQIGDGVEVIALTSVTANLIAIFGGIVVFHDPIGSGPPPASRPASSRSASSSPVPRSCQPRCAPRPRRLAHPSLLHRRTRR